jgi:hypothetical protein
MSPQIIPLTVFRFNIRLNQSGRLKFIVCARLLKHIELRFCFLQSYRTYMNYIYVIGVVHSFLPDKLMNRNSDVSSRFHTPE